MDEAEREQEIAEGRAHCPGFRAGRPCVMCDHEHCGWCGDCHPEVPEWN